MSDKFQLNSEELVILRKAIHQHPELSGQEHETRERVKAYCERFGGEMIELGATGLAIVFDSGKSGDTVLFRSELDALPIKEINTFDYASVKEKVSHKCGHDGHTTVLCGLAQRLAAHPPESGKIVLLFQPAEENGKGAQEVLSDERFSSIEPDWVFAYHNLPGYPLKQVVYRTGAFTAAAKSIVVKLKGKTSHAAEPELGHNPASAIADILNYGNELTDADLDSDGFFLVTPVYVTMGEKAYGVSAGYGEVHLTLRSFSNAVMDARSHDLANKAEAIATKYSLNSDISWTEVFAANENNEQAVKLITEAAGTIGLDAISRPQPFKWGEDFGLFTQRYQGAMFGIGSGEACPALHNPDYDFPDEMIPEAVELFETIAKQILG